MKKFGKIIVAALLCILMFASVNYKVEAAEKSAVGFVPFGNSLMWMYSDGTFLTNDWLRVNGLTYHFDANGLMQIGFQKIGNNFYYFDPTGQMVTSSFITIGDGVYYFNSKGIMVKNKTVQGVKIGADGRVIPSSAPSNNATVGNYVKAEIPVTGTADRSLILNTANYIIASATNASMTQEQKLRACYDYIMATTSYERSYEVPSGDWTVPYAMEVYSRGKGNCYKYAAAFAYLARALGYDTKVVTGQVSAARGGTTPHAWAEVFINNGWYVFDCELQDAKPKYNLYMRTYANYPIVPLNKEVEWPVFF